MITTIDKYNKWLDSEGMPEELRAELQSIQFDSGEIEDRFYRQLEFGTGGMRGLLGAGTNRMNIFTIRHVAEGLALLIKENGTDAMRRGVAIAYDTRHYSFEFAMEVAKILGKHGVRIYLFKESRPTPELSFAIRHFNAFAGIVITASHNPKEYNGIKVYGEDGGQLPPDAAVGILTNMKTIDDILIIDTAREETLVASGLLIYVLEEVDAAYQTQLLTLRSADLSRDALTIVYSPLHGTGNIPVRQGLQAFGFENVHIVAEQELPDPDFSTVLYPNPEEREAFELAIEVGKKVNADLLLATDPDADRLGVAVRTAAGDYELLSGNQLGAVLLHFILMKRKAQNNLPANGVVMKTIVTSEMGRAVAAEFGIPTIDTLTGFKYISEKIESFSKTGDYTFLFGYEESYGYLIGDFVRDKDAVQAALLTAEAAAYYKAQGSSLYEALLSLYEQVGHYRESLKSLTASGKDGNDRITRIMATFRNNPPKVVGGIHVSSVEDYHSRTVKTADGQQSAIELPVADVIKFHLRDGSWICIRPSGTEPKCKFYFGVRKGSRLEAEQSLERLELEVMSVVESIV